MHALTSFVISLLTVASGFVGGIFHPSGPVVGATLPQSPALFETSLASRISSSDTSMTLVSNNTGGSSIGGYTCFTIDEGRSDAEFVCGTVSGTSVTSLERGVSYTTGTTTVSSRAFPHRVGANVKITDYPLIQRLKAQANGEDTYANIISYTAHPTFTATTQIVDKKYVDDTAFSGAGVVDATQSARGVVELATGAEAASSTANGSSGALVIAASNATSSCSGATAALKAVITNNSGTIDSTCIPSTISKALTITGNLTLSNATSTIASSTVEQYVATSTTNDGVFTWTKPNNLKYADVICVGGGGGAGHVSSSPPTAGAGGGAGVAEGIIPAAAIGATVTVTAGKGGAALTSGTGSGTNGGNSSFGSFVIGNGGGGGGNGGNAGTGGSGTGAIVLPGANGNPVSSGSGGSGGDTQGFGSGGMGALTGGPSAGNSYGGGGGGPSGTGTGGNGAPGMCIVRTYFF